MSAYTLKIRNQPALIRSMRGSPHGVLTTARALGSEAFPGGFWSFMLETRSFSLQADGSGNLGC